MVSKEELQAVRDGNAVDEEGQKIGSVGQVYVDDQTGEPAWITVNTGLFGTSESFVPLQGARFEGDQVHVPHSKSKVKDAPRVDADQHLDVEHEQELYRYYGLDYGRGRGDASGRAGDRSGDASPAAGAAGTAGAAGAAAGADARRGTDARPAGDRDVPAAGREAQVGHPDAAAADTDDARRGRVPGDDDAVVRHEEHLNVGTETRATGTVRLRKYVTTETETVEVPVRREEVHVERVPVAGEGKVVDGDPFEESTQEVTTHEQVPVVRKEAHAVEEVKLGTETVHDTETVSDTVRKEHVDVDHDARGGTPRDGRDGDTRR